MTNILREKTDRNRIFRKLNNKVIIQDYKLYNKRAEQSIIFRTFLKCVIWKIGLGESANVPHYTL